MSKCGEESGIINVRRLPVTESIGCGDYIIVDDGVNGTSIIDFCNILIGESQVTFDDVLTTVRSNSADWKTTHTTVLTNSAAWQFKTKIFDHSDGWNSTWTTVSSNSASWNQSVLWGDHSLAGYLKANAGNYLTSESDPIFTAHTAYTITSQNKTDWNSDHTYYIAHGVGSVPGSAVANKLLIVDSNKDLTGIRNLTVEGDLNVQGKVCVTNTIDAGADITAFSTTCPGSNQQGIGSSNYTFIHAYSVSTVGFTNIVGHFDGDSNYFDVFPPAGKTMSNLEAFTSSIHTIHFAGDVNNDDSIRCEYAVKADRIRVWVQGTEQRVAPGANYLAIWN